MTRPPITYPLYLNELELFTDAAAELDTMRRFYIDQPGEQMRIAGMVRRMYDAIERAASIDASLLLIRSDGSDNLQPVDGQFTSGDMADAQAKAFVAGQLASQRGSEGVNP